MKGKNISNKFSKIKENLKNNKSLIYKIVIFICILSGTFLIGFTLIIWKTFLHTDQTILKAINKKVELIKANPHYGNPISKRLIPQEYKEINMMFLICSE